MKRPAPTPVARLLAAFLLGLACAVWLVPAVAGPLVQRLRLERDQARAEAEELRADVNRLQEAERKKQAKKPVVRRARALIEGPDQRVALEVERRLQQQLAPQVGRPVEEISFMLLYASLHGSIMTIDGVLYRISVRTIVIGQELTVYGSASTVK